ncbi:MAG: AAA family ATPase [Rhizobiaceae bacterium]|nr:AAA family ATPase [Rhizobiaceae bacterium]MCV0405186.1 AAA family ATPase [Rhizobiaceae bacterium]
MAVPSDNFFVLTGGPGSGKTTLIGELARRGVNVSEESGRAVIREQIEAGGSALPWLEREAFARLMFERELVSWRDAAKLGGPVFFDRGIADTIGYLRLEGLAVPSQMLRAASRFRYARTVFAAPFWADIYVTDAERRQDETLARATFHAVTAAWRELGYDIVELPLSTAARRADFVLDRAHRPIRG